MIPDPAERTCISQMIAGDDLNIMAASDLSGAADALSGADCLIVDGRSGFDFAALDHALEGRHAICRLPIVVSQGRELGEWPPSKNFDHLTIKPVHSREHLVDMVAFLLHRRVTRLPEAQHRLLERLHESDTVLAGKRVLIVDDDIRNNFALASVLEEHGTVVESAGNGRDALRIMRTQSRVDVVLMDIMMPDMDGIATMKEARKLPSCRDVPIIAVTAKAMKGDREKCIRAGAWDYLSKPVDTVHLLAVLRGWLHR
jgi:CheY-like chemotaxis protein